MMVDWLFKGRLLVYLWQYHNVGMGPGLQLSIMIRALTRQIRNHLAFKARMPGP